MHYSLYQQLATGKKRILDTIWLFPASTAITNHICSKKIWPEEPGDSDYMGRNLSQYA